MSEELLKGAFINVLNIFIYDQIYFKTACVLDLENVVRLLYCHFTCFGRLTVKVSILIMTGEKGGKMKKRNPPKRF